LSSSVERSSVTAGLSEPPARYLGVQDVIAGGSHTLLLSGELDLASASYLEAAIERICTDSARAITLDLSKLTFIDSTGLHIVSSTNERCEKLGLDFQLVPGPAQIQRVFELTGLLDELPFQAAAA
jgi:anti-sigma B factor antagonist